MKKKIKKIHTKVIKKLSKGKNLLTVMIVPHSEKKIISFQISYFTLFFIAFLLSSIFVITFFALKSHPETLKSQRVFESTNQKYLNILNKFLSTSINILDEDKKIKNIFKNLIIDENNQNIEENITNKIFKKISKEKLSSNHIEEIHHLMQFEENIERINTNTNNIINSIKNFRILAKSIPSIWPLIGSGILTSGYGPRIDPFTIKPVFHPGIDISAFAGTPVRATADGIVKVIDFSHGTGNMIIIEHKYQFYTAYCHLQKAAVSIGDKVKRGEIIGYVGNTGRSVGYHLHYEVRIQNESIDPLPFLRLDSFQD